jgi:hypothetical protein
MGEMRNVYNILAGKAPRKKRLCGPGRRWDDNIQIDLTEI